MTPKRARLIDIGVAIAETGLENLTMTAVAKTAGLTYQAVRYHFPGGRDELRSAVIEHACRSENTHITVQLSAMRQVR